MRNSEMHTIAKLVSVLAISGMGWHAHAALFDSQEFTALQRVASEKQYVRVIIDLNIDVPLAAPKKQPAALKAALAAMEAAVIKSLGNGALKTGFWRNGLGQIGLYVTENGLKALTDNENVRTFGIDPTGVMRAGVYEDDGRISRIVTEIGRNGYADVEVTLNLEDLDFTIGRDARVVHKPTAAQRTEVQAKVASLRATLPQHGTMNSIQARSDVQADGPSQTMRIDMEGLLALRENENVRGLRLVNDDANAPGFQMDPEVLEMARQVGYADVTADLRRPSVYTPMQGRLPAKAWQAQAKAIQEAFTDIFSRTDQMT